MKEEEIEDHVAAVNSEESCWKWNPAAVHECPGEDEEEDKKSESHCK